MKKTIYIVLFCVAVGLGLAAASCGSKSDVKTITILTTNDIHAKIDQFPHLATAVKMCRDTSEHVLLVDAGDKWTGNAYVDLVENRQPMLDLMAAVGYTVGTIGNHGYDGGHGELANMISNSEFPIILANMESETPKVPQPKPYLVVKEGGVKFGFVGVVTNYEGDDTPAGTPEVFEGLEFDDPKDSAREVADELKDEVDVLILLSHMGLDHDRLFAQQYDGYDYIVGGHSHDVIDEVIGGTALTQNGKDMKLIGAMTLTIKDDEVIDMDFRSVPLSDYAADPEMQAMVDGFKQNEELNKPIGEFASGADEWALANMFADLMKQGAKADIGVYHAGGVRLDTIPAGGVGMITAFNIEPFGTEVLTIAMTPEEIEEVILEKYNDGENLKEAGRLDLFMTTPYSIVLGDDAKAEHVVFGDLKDNVRYTVAWPDYVVKTYEGLDLDDAESTGLDVRTLFIEMLKSGKPFSPDLEHKQSIITEF